MAETAARQQILQICVKQKIALRTLTKSDAFIMKTFNFTSPCLANSTKIIHHSKASISFALNGQGKVRNNHSLKEPYKKNINGNLPLSFNCTCSKVNLGTSHPERCTKEIKTNIHAEQSTKHYQNRLGQQRIIQWTLASNKANTIKADNITHSDSEGLWHCCHIALLSNKNRPVVPVQSGKHVENQFKHSDE